MKKLRVAHIITSLKRGGAESSLVHLVTYLQSRGFENHVIYFYEGPNARALKERGVATYHITGLVTMYDPVLLIRLARLLMRLAPDCVHTALWSANVVGRLTCRILGIAHLSVLHLACNNEVRNKHDWLRDTLDYQTARFTDQLIAVSDDVAKQFRIRAPFIPAHCITVIKNGIDSSIPLKRAAQRPLNRTSFGLSEEHFVVGSVGRFIERKNYSLLIKAVASVVKTHHMIRLILVGGGPEEDALRRLAHMLGIEEYVTFIVGDEAYAYYPLFDCFVLVSIQEGLSIALLEAFCFSLPVITSHGEVGKKHEVVVDGEHGFLIDATDQKALEKYLKFFIENRDKAQEMGHRNKQYVTTSLSMKRMGEEYEKALLNIAFRHHESDDLF